MALSRLACELPVALCEHLVPKTLAAGAEALGRPVLHDEHAFGGCDGMSRPMTECRETRQLEHGSRRARIRVDCQDDKDEEEVAS